MLCTDEMKISFTCAEQGHRQTWSPNIRAHRPHLASHPAGYKYYICQREKHIYYTSPVTRWRHFLVFKVKATQPSTLVAGQNNPSFLSARGGVHPGQAAHPHSHSEPIWNRHISHTPPKNACMSVGGNRVSREKRHTGIKAGNFFL